MCIRDRRIGASILVATAFALMLARKSVDKNELEEKFRVIFTFSPDYMLVGRMSDGTIVEVNDGLETMTGYKASEVIGKTTIDLNAWDDLTPVSYTHLDVYKRQHQFSAIFLASVLSSASKHCSSLLMSISPKSDVANKKSANSIPVWKHASCNAPKNCSKHNLT